MQSMKNKMKRFVFGTEDTKQPDGVYMDSNGTGVLGEVRAEQYLVERGYQILARNAVFPTKICVLRVCTVAQEIFSVP